jgi:hypothetical protein
MVVPTHANFQFTLICIIGVVTSIPLIHPTLKLDPYKFLANSFQMTWTRLIQGLQNNLYQIN